MFAALVVSEAVLEVVHCAAGPFAFVVLASVEDAENVLGIVCHHAEECSDPHPEHSARAAQADSGRDTCDVTRTDRCCQCRAESLELGNGSLLFFVMALLVEHAAACLFPPVSCVGDLEEFGYDSHQDARPDQKEKADLDPYERIHCIVDVRKTGKKIAHKLGLSKKLMLEKYTRKSVLSRVLTL